MALPTLDKTWQFNVNQIVANQGGSATNTNRRLMRTLKNTFTSWPSNPWTVRGSSNSVTAAMDSTDRWVTDTDLVMALTSGVHSWIVLRQTGIATNYELCIDLINVTAGSNFSICSKYISPSAGFTGGSTTARPTATDEILLPAPGFQTSWGPGGNSPIESYVIHGMQSTDGQATHVFIQARGVNVAVLHFSRPKNPVTGWTNPSVGLWDVENSNGVTTNHQEAADASLFNTLTPVLRGRGSAAMGMYLMSEGTRLGTTGLFANTFNLPNSFSGEWDMSPIAVASDTASHRGRHGQLFDLWTGGALNILNGNTYPADTSRQFCQFGIFVAPWNGTTPVTYP